MRDDKLTNPTSGRPWMIRALPWISLVTTMALTASGEFTLAVQCGFPMALAAGYPLALDSYAISAFHGHSKVDVVVSIGLMMACQVLSHLAAVDIIGVTWWLVVIVACVPPLVLWRVHHLVGGQDSEPEPVAVPSVSEATPSQPELVPVHVSADAGRRPTPPPPPPPAHTAERCLVASTVHDQIQAVRTEHPDLELAGIAEAVDRSERTVQRCINGR